MSDFEATTTETDGLVRVALTGECDLAVCDRLTTILRDAVSRSPMVVVDLDALAFLDSSGLHGLVTAHHHALSRGGRLVVENQHGPVATVLDLTGIGALLQP
jgi:anti-sigma B factor antagonist